LNFENPVPIFNVYSHFKWGVVKAQGSLVILRYAGDWKGKVRRASATKFVCCNHAIDDIFAEQGDIGVLIKFIGDGI
jgi:hypothetical protein